jgi:hypothetical protein
MRRIVAVREIAVVSVLITMVIIFDNSVRQLMSLYIIYEDNMASAATQPSMGGFDHTA